MGESDEVSKSVKKTQEQLGRFVKKPPLTDKNLSRPPFRFLHDIVHNVVDTTGFLSGVFTPEELDASNITTREAKTAFMQKLIQAIKDKTGEDVPIKISKVLAGLEADKTNGLLQSLAKGIEVHQQEGGAAPPSSGTKRGSGGTTKKPPAGGGSKTTTGKPGTVTKQESTVKIAAKGTSKAGEKKDASSKRTIRDPSPANKATAAAKKSDPALAPGSGGTKKPSRSKAAAAPPAAEAPPPAPAAPEIPESVVNDETVASAKEENRSKKLTRRDSAADLTRKKSESIENPPEEVDSLDNVGAPSKTSSAPQDDNANKIDNLNNNNDNDNKSKNRASSSGGGEDETQHELYDNFAASVVKPNMQTLPPPKSPILSDADAVIATMAPPGTGDISLTPTKSRSLTPSMTPSMTPSPNTQLAAIGGGGGARPTTGTGPRSLSRETSAEQNSKGSPFGSATIGEVRPPTGQQVRSRPDTGTTSASSRMSSARPPSARRAPPRPKSSVVREEAEPYRPTTGKVAHVIMDNAEDPDDDNYVVREVTVTAASKAPGLSDLDETPELAMANGGHGGILGGILGGSGEIDGLLPPDQQGLLVHQILETQKELEDKKSGGGGGEETTMIDKKMKELSLAEIEKLKNLIQRCARSANPLAKLLDYMAEDVDSMQKEYNSYREESKRLTLDLENAKGETDKFLQGLKHELNDIERKIKDKEDGILASQMKIIQQEERIEEIVNGFERVRSGKSAAAAKDHMPQADEILAHIQGQSSAGLGGGFGSGGGPNSTFTFSAVGVASTPSSAASVGGDGAGQPFKIPDSFMVNSASSGSVSGGGGGGARGDLSSPFSRGRVWSTMANNNSATFDMKSSLEEDNDEQPLSSFSTRRNMGRSGGGGSFKRGMTTNADFQQGDGNFMDVDNFNPWS